MCEMCLAKPTEFGEIIPGFTLIRATEDTDNVKAGQYAISEGMWASVVFPEEPWAEPCDGMTDEEIDALPPDSDIWTKNTAWFTAGTKFENACQMYPELGWKIVEAAKKAGFDPKESGRLSLWLFNRAGVMLRDNQKGKTWAELNDGRTSCSME